MQLYGLEKIRIFQNFYFEQNGVKISYREAVHLFYQMDNDTRSEFEEYYKDETGYEIISSSGYNFDVNIPEPTVVGKKNARKKVKQEDGSIKWVNVENGANIWSQYSSAVSQNAIQTKYTIEGFMKEQGMVLDPKWAGFSAEEIMQMVNDGVNVPQEVVDIANTILQSSGVNLTDAEVNDDTTEKEPFLELVPKAVKHIEDCNETQEVISEEIFDLLPEKQKCEDILNGKLKEQKQSLKEYKDIVTEWKSLKDKINNGEILSDKEHKRYAELSKMLGASKEIDTDVDVKKIASSLNEINILALLGEQLADKTIEIGETLEDYTSETNYKQTSKEVSAVVGPFFTFIAMAHGKYIAEEAVKVGNETKAYTEETANSINNIAEALDIEDRISTIDEEGNIVEPEAPENDTQQNEQQSEQKSEEEFENKFFFVTDAEVLRYIKEAREINSELYKQIEIALEQIKIAKQDVKFAKIANKIITKIVNEFLAQEKIRQHKIEKEEDKKKDAERKAEQAKSKIEEAQIKITDTEAEIQELKTNKKVNEKYGSANSSEIDAEIEEKEGIIAEQEIIIDEQTPIVEAQNEIIEVHNKKITQIQLESKKEKEKVKQKTIREKSAIDKATKVENNSLKINTEYQERDLPKHNDRMDFINRAGLSLMEIGTGEIAIGSYLVYIGHSLLPNIFTHILGLELISLGSMFIVKGCISVGIGATACVVSDDESLIDEAQETTNTAGKNINNALTNLNGVNNKLATVIEEYSTEDTDEQASGMKGADDLDNGDDEGDTDNNNGTNPSEGDGNNLNLIGTGLTLQSVPQVTSSLQQTPAMTAAPVVENPETTEPPSGNTIPVSESPEASQRNSNAVDSNQDTPTNPQNTNPPASNGFELGNTTAQPVNNSAQRVSFGGSSSSSRTKYDESCDSGPVKDQQEQVTDDADEKLDKIDSETKDDAKDSESIEKDAKKDKKQLEKETKKLIKQLKKDEKKINKMTKESIKAAKKQEEILNQYALITAENERLMAEDEARQNANAAMGVPQNNGDQNGQNEQNGQNGVLASNSFSMNEQPNNNAKLEENSQKITTLSGEYKICTRTITTNQKAIKQLQKTTKNKQKKFNKKTKILNKKIKEEEKAENEKQKRLNTQLAVVGVQENIFSLTSAIGQIWNIIATGELSNPFTAIKGAADLTVATLLVTIGTIGSLACQVTKSIINLANGNLMGALMGLGTAAVSIATSFIPGANQAVNTVLGCVSQGLNVVSTSAELVNNVRTLQGKEAIGALSMVSTIAGTASAVTNMASSLGNLGNMGTFGKIATIASAVGTTISSTSQIMSEFGVGGKATQILGTIGGAVQMGASIMQMADGFKNSNKANKSENSENTNEGQNSEQNTKSNNNKAKVKNGKLVNSKGEEVKLPEGCKIEDGKVIDKNGNEVKVNNEGKIVQTKKQSENSQKTKETPEEKKMRKEQEKLEKQEKAQQKQQEKEQHKQELEDARKAKQQKKTEAKQAPDKQSQKNMKEQGASLEFASYNEEALKAEIQKANQAGDTNRAKQLENELQNRTKYQNQIGLIKENNQAKQDKISNIFNIAGQAASAVMSAFASTQGSENSATKRKYAAPGTLTKRTKEIMKKNKKFRERRVQSLSRSQRYYA